MAWLHFVSYLFGGFFLYNAVPDFLSGVCCVRDFSLRSTVHAIALGAGFRVMGLFDARHFAHFHGGNSSEDSSAH